ncbi:3D domain-containing protein, partial [Nanoarchaeota archaeon]
SIAVNLRRGTNCYIPRWSRVYIKYPKPNHPFTGWYIAEDTGGAFGGKCKIDVFLGAGKQSVIGSPNPTVSKNDQSQWPEVWVFPGKKTPDLWDDNMYTFIVSGRAGTGAPPGQSGVPTSASAPTTASTRPPVGGPRGNHPSFAVPYSVDASFSVDVPYDFSIYEFAHNKTKKLDRCLAKIDCIKGNLTKMQYEKPNIKMMAKYGGNLIVGDWNDWWQICESFELNAVNSLAEGITECMRSPENNCACPYLIPFSPARELAATNPVFRDFGFLGLTQTMSFPDRMKIKISEQGSNTLLGTGSVSATVAGSKLEKIDKSLNNILDANLAKDKIISYKPMALDMMHIYKKNQNTFSLYLEGQSPAKDKLCKVNNKVVKFCFGSNKTFIAYDQKKDRFGIVPIAIKFAYIFKSKVSEVKNFEVHDHRIASNMTLLSWDKMTGVDIQKYTVYIFNDSSITPQSLKNLKPSEVRIDPKFKNKTLFDPIDLDVNNKQEFYDMEWPLVPECKVSGTTCKRTYDIKTTVQTPVDRQELPESDPKQLELYLHYLSHEDKQKFFIIIKGTEDEKQYTYAITASEPNGEESPSFSFPKNPEKSKDDLPPALPGIGDPTILPGKIEIPVIAPTDNIDETKMDKKQIEIFRAYCFPDTISEIDMTKAINHISAGSAKYLGTDPTKLTVSNTGCNGAGPKYILVTTRDKKGREFAWNATIDSALSVTLIEQTQ